MVLLSSFSLAAVGLSIGCAAHGAVRTITAEGLSLDAFAKTYFNNKPTPAWKTPKQIEGAFGIGRYGPLNASHYRTPHINCHLEAQPGDLWLEVQAGHSVQLQWNSYPDTHHGPVIDYLANCNGDCTRVDPSKLRFNKISEMGLISTELHKYPDEKKPTTQFASDKLIRENSQWTVTIPSYVAPGTYVLRHEVIALHNSWTPGGAQHLPQCFNLNVTGGGTDELFSGILGTDLYSTSQPGLGVINIYQNPPKNYTIPGPPLYTPNSQSQHTTTSSSVATSFPGTHIGATLSAKPTSTTRAVDSSADGCTTLSSVQPVETNTSTKLVVDSATIEELLEQATNLVAKLNKLLSA